MNQNVFLNDWRDLHEALKEGTVLLPHCPGRGGQRLHPGKVRGNVLQKSTVSRPSCRFSDYTLVLLPTQGRWHPWMNVDSCKPVMFLFEKWRTQCLLAQRLLIAATLPWRADGEHDGSMVGDAQLMKPHRRLRYNTMSSELGEEP